jgi:hypothetical protein
MRKLSTQFAQRVAGPEGYVGRTYPSLPRVSDVFVSYSLGYDGLSVSSCSQSEGGMILHRKAAYA